MREVSISCGFLAFLPVPGKPSRVAQPWAKLRRFSNGSETSPVARRDTDATWRSLGIVCRERGWSESRALHELQNGLPYQTVPPLPSGRSIDWHDPMVAYGLNVETGDVTLTLGVFGGPGLGFDTLTVSVEVLAADDAEVAAAPTDTPPAAQALPAADAPLASAQWAAVTVRAMLGEDKLPDEARKTKRGLARLLEAEAKAAVRAGRLGRALRASYLENQLEAWGIWPLSSIK
jgi:hypothetical protein